MVRAFFVIFLMAGVAISENAAAQCPSGGTIQITINTDQWGDETSWEVRDQITGALVQSGGGFNYVGNSTYNHTVCVDPTRCYYFVIYDVFSDGMCCLYGLGSYTVRYNGAIIRTGGSFGSSETTLGIGSGCGSQGNGPLVTDNTTYTPEELITEVLLGSCVEASNVQFTGNAISVGYFTNGSGIGMESGILLTSGSAANAEGPNSFDDATVSVGTPGDADLDAAANLGGLSTDAASLEFDFVSFNDTVTFQYIFGSDEYPEYVCSQFNDAFAFLVSGPGYAPNTNIAIIPGTNVPVAINSVNNGSPGAQASFPPACVSLANTAYYVANFGNTTEYDAYTVPITATMVVQPCQTYHIKLVIADVLDRLYDSGVFLKAQSFSGGQSVSIQATDNAGSKNTLEACMDGRFTFTREDTGDVSTDLTIYYTVSGTATEGVDYSFIPDSIVIPANQISASVYIHPADDGVSEGGESVILTYQDQCACNQFKRDTIFIYDNIAMLLNLSGPTVICAGQSATITANAGGSFSIPYTYQWAPNGETTQSITVSPLATTTYTVTVTDRCQGQQVIASRTITVESTSASFTPAATPQCASQNDFDFINTGTYTGTATFNWNMGDNNTLTTEDVLNYSYAAGTYDVELIVTDRGCSDTARQTVTLLAATSVNIDTTICNGDSIFLAGAWRTTSGVYPDLHTGSNGCDSNYITTLTVLQYQLATASVAICPGDSVFLGGAWRFGAGSFTDTILSATSCDTLLTTTVTVDPYVTATATAAICLDDSIFLGGAWRFTAGNYLDTIAASVGCDTVRTTTLTIDPYITAPTSVSICQDDSILIGGVWRTAAGVYIDTVAAGTGCDTIFSTTLTIDPYNTAFAHVTICDDDSVFLAGAWQTTGGQYVDTVAAITGCDTILTTTLVVTPTVTSTNDVTLCAGDSTFAGGAWQKQSGTWVDTYTAATTGCDSIVTTTLTVNDTFRVNIPVTICPGDSVQAGGGWQTQAGDYYDYLLTSDGCDSIIVTTVTVNNIIYTQADIERCEGDSFFAEGAWQFTSGVYVDTFLVGTGCDSVATTTLTFHDTTTTIVAQRICEGDSILIDGTWQTQARQYIYTLQSRYGCDSTIVLNLSVDPIVYATDSVAICAGESHFAGGALQTQAGVYTDTFAVLSTGCDSILTTTITVLDTFLATPVVYICPGDSAWAGGAWQTQAGVYTDALTTVFGCDSVIRTTVVVQAVIDVPLSVSLCQGDSTQAGGAWQTQAGVYVDSFIAAGGCDSIVTTTVIVYDTFFHTRAVTRCEGDSFFVGGSWQTLNGQYTDFLQSAQGCDSTVVTTLTFDTIVFQSSAEIICFGDSLLAGGGWQTTSGVYVDTLTSSAGCDSIHTTTLTVDTVLIAGFDAAICAGQTANLSVPGVYFSYDWQPGGETTASIDAVGGNYILTVSDSICSDTAQFNVAEQSVSVDAVAQDTTILRGQSAQIIVQGGDNTMNYVWTPTDFLDCTDCGTSAVATPFDDIIYTIYVTDDLGCGDTTSIQIIVDTIPLPRFYAPNAFTPNGDGVNDEFVVEARHYLTYHLLVFNRWGEKVFETYNQQEGWNGTHNGKICNPGVYVYYVDVSFINEHTPKDMNAYKKGSVTLIR